MLTGAKNRAATTGKDYDLNMEWLLEKMNKGICELTGLPFDYTVIAKNKQSPFGPSLDRVDSSKGYTQDNTRVVVVIANLAKNSWTAEIVKKFASALLTHAI